MPSQPGPIPGWASWTSAQIIAESIARNGYVGMELLALDQRRLLDCQEGLLRWQQPELNGRQEPPALYLTYVKRQLTRMLAGEPLAQDASRLARLPSAQEMITMSKILEERSLPGEPSKVVILPGPDPQSRMLRMLQLDWAQNREQLNRQTPNAEQQNIAAAISRNVDATASSPHPRSHPKALILGSARMAERLLPTADQGPPTGRSPQSAAAVPSVRQPTMPSSTATRSQSRESPSPSRNPSPPPPGQSR